MKVLAEFIRGLAMSKETYTEVPLLQPASKRVTLKAHTFTA